MVAMSFLTIMGSGETSPTMVKVHRDLFERLGPEPVPAVVIDTPFGFQENADELLARAQDYFRVSVGREFGVASLRTPDTSPDAAIARLQEARYVFAGPGSPSYALRVWRACAVPAVLAAKLTTGGEAGGATGPGGGGSAGGGRGAAVTFASAAALTLGRVAVPVYEVYKVGAEPSWLEALDLVGAATSLSCAVIPHFNNAEGGTHDTRYCYLGERRLRVMEAQLAPGTWVLGVDEHTGVVFDLEARTVSVVGLGVMTVRVQGQATEVPAGTTMTIEELAALAQGGAGARVAGSVPAAPGGRAGGARPAAPSPLLETVATLEAKFEAALAGRDGPGAAGAVLELEAELAAWSHETFSSDERERARASVRAMVVRLGEAAAAGLADPAALVGPYVETALEMRNEARRAGRYEDADAVRARLVALGIEVHDSPDGTTWELAR